MYLREAELSAPVTAWLNGRGYDVWAEVPCSGVVDLVGKHRETGRIACVELKTGFTAGLFYQVRRHSWAVTDTYGAAPTWPSPIMVEKYRRAGCGMLMVDGPLVYVRLRPFELEPVLGIDHDHDCWMFKRMRVHFAHNAPGGIGGKPNLAGTGPAQDFRRRALAWLAENPGSTWRDAYEHVSPNHYCSYASMKGAMKRLEEILAWREKKKASGLPESL